MPVNRASHRSTRGKSAGSRRDGHPPHRPSSPGGRPLELGVWIRAAVIVLAGAAAYGNSLAGPFVNDDHLSIVANRQIRGFWPLSSLLLPDRELPVAGRPLVNITLAINFAAGGFDVRGYHLVNVAIHLLCALVLFGTIRRTLNLPSVRSRLPARPRDVAFACALIWTLHPLQTETVDYITQRTESLMALFYLLTLYTSVRASLSPTGWLWHTACVMCCALGMACKESMVTAPVMVMLYDRVFLFDSMTHALRRRWGLYIALMATWAELAALMMSGPRIHSAGFSAGIHPWTYLLNQTVMIAHYLWLAIWPRALVFDYGVPLPLTLNDVMPYAIGILVLLSMTAVAMVRRPELGFLGAWFFVTLAPTSSIVPIATEVGAERRMYLPLAAIVVLAVVAVVFLWQRVGRAAGRVVEPSAGKGFAIGMLVLTAASAALAAGTVARNRHYASIESLARTSLERWPQPRVHRMLAAALFDLGRRDEGMTHLRQAMPDDHRAYYSMGMELFRDGKLSEAIDNLQEFIRLEPLLLEVISARETIGLALQRQGKLEEAADQFRMILKMTPGYAGAHGRLADVLFTGQKFEEAAVHYETYLKSQASDFNALTNLAISQAATDRIDEALQRFQQAVELQPGNSAARRNLANTLLTKRSFNEAARQAQEAVTLNPRDAVAHDILGLALASSGRIDDAIEHFRLSLQLDPKDTDVRDHLSVAQRMKGATPP